MQMDRTMHLGTQHLLNTRYLLHDAITQAHDDHKQAGQGPLNCRYQLCEYQ